MLLVSCGGDDNNEPTEPLDEPPVGTPSYTFNSHLSSYEDQSISYTGQTTHHMLIAYLTQKICGLNRGGKTSFDKLKAFIE